jgi:hypothetical protein
MGDLFSVFWTFALHGMLYLLYILSAFFITFICIHVVHRIERRRRLHLPGIAVVPGPKSADYSKVLDEASEKVFNLSFL